MGYNLYLATEKKNEYIFKVGLNCKKKKEIFLNKGNLDCAQIARHSLPKKG